VRSRLTGITRERTRLIEKAVSTAKTHKAKEKSVDGGAKPVEGKSSGQAEGFKAISDMDARVAELEKLIGSNTIMIDEVSSKVYYSPFTILNLGVCLVYTITTTPTTTNEPSGQTGFSPKQQQEP